MKNKTKITLCCIFLAIGLSTFIFEVLGFPGPDGNLGFLVCLTSVYIIIGSLIRLAKYSTRVRKAFTWIIELIFWLP